VILAFSIDICVDRTRYQRFVVISRENTILRSMKIIFIIASLQANSISFMFMMVRFLKIYNVVLDFG
jgi:hypothetical protein